MTIREKGYHSWDGQLKRTGISWLPMFYSGIRMVFKRKWSKLLFVFAIPSFLWYLLLVYASSRPELKMLGNVLKQLQNDAEFFKSFAIDGWVFFMLMLMGIVFGVESISGDIQFKSFPLYFSRPLDRKDYLFGKYSILMFYFLLFTLAPALLLLMFKIIFTGKISLDPLFLFALIVTPVLIALFLTSLTLMVSSFSGNSKYTRILLILVFFISSPIAWLLKRIFGSAHFLMIGCTEILNQLGTFLFRTDPAYAYPGWMSLAVVLFVSLVAYYILYIRIGKLEAQIESGN